MANLEVIGLGALNMDYLYRVDRIVEDGETVVDEAVSTPGGSAANTIYGLARLGTGTGFVGAVGDDTDGKTLIQDFQAAGVETRHIAIKRGFRSGSVLCLTEKVGKRSLYVNPGANSQLTGDDIDISYLNQAKILHVASFVSDEQFRLTQEVLARLNASVKLSFAPGMLYTARGPEALVSILERAHVIFLNQTELQQLTGEESVTTGVARLQQGCQIVVVTLGQGETLKRGKVHRAVNAIAYIRDASDECVVERVQIANVADTTGAGDAFATGFVYGLLKGKGLEVCGRLGNTVAQFCIAKMGARAGLPALNQLAQRYYILYGQEI